MDTDRYFVILMVCLVVLSIPLASALRLEEIDNVKAYDVGKREYSISDSMLWLWKTEELARVTLVSPDVVYTAPGYQKVAEFDLVNRKEYHDVLSDMRLVNLKEGGEEQRNLDYKIAVVTGQREVLIYNTSCSENHECPGNLLGSRMEDIIEYQDLDIHSTLPAGTYRISIWTNVRKGETIDWIPTFYGQELSEWAVWSDSLNVGLQRYYTMNDTSNPLYDSSDFGENSSNDIGTIDYGQNGRNGTSLYFNAGEGVIMNGINNSGSNIGNTGWTISVWWNVSAAISHQIGYTQGLRAILKHTADSAFVIEVDGIEFGCSGYAMPGNTWQHQAVVVNSSGTHMFHNGTRCASNAHNADWLTASENFGIGCAMTTASGCGTDDIENGWLDEFGFWNRSLSVTEIEALATGITISKNSTAIINLNSPANNTITGNDSMIVNCSISGAASILNLSLLVNDVVNTTVLNETGAQEYLSLQQNLTALTDGIYNWTCSGFTTAQSVNSPPERRFTIDLTAPTIGITSPNGTINYQEIYEEVNLSWVVNDPSMDSCWYVFNSSNISVTCGDGNDTFLAPSFDEKTVTFWANDTYGNLFGNTSTWNYSVFENNASTIKNFSIVEGSQQFFYKNISWDNGTYDNIVGYIVFNGTSYLMDATGSGNNRWFTDTLTMPFVSGEVNYTYYYMFTLYEGVAETSIFTETYYATVSTFAVDDCTIYSTLLYNITLFDENTRLPLNGSANNTELQIDLTFYSIGTTTEILAYSNTFNETNPVQICTNDTLDANGYTTEIIASQLATNYVTEFYYVDNGTISNSLIPINIDLYDLNVDDSTTFLFYYYNELGIALPESIARVFRQYIGDGTFVEVERARQDQNGETHIHLIEEDAIYYFVITEENQVVFTSSTYSARCQAVPCTITIEESGTYDDWETDFDLFPNGSYAVSIDHANRQVQLNYTATAVHVMNLTLYEYESDGTYTEVDSDVDTGTSGTLTVTAPISYGNKSFFVALHSDNSFIRSYWADFNEKAYVYIGTTLALFMVGIIILTLALMAVTEGAAVIIIVLIGAIVAGILGLVDYRVNGVTSILIYLIIAGGIIIFKLSRKR